jgi:hypothetical protein
MRMMKLRMKISGTFRTFEGAQVFADIRSVILTVRKHEGNIIETLPYHHNRLSLGSNLASAAQNPISAGVLGSY